MTQLLYCSTIYKGFLETVYILGTSSFYPNGRRLMGEMKMAVFPMALLLMSWKTQKNR